MKLTSTAVLSLLGCASAAVAQERFPRAPQPDADPNRLSVGGLFLFNAKATFKTTGLSLSTANPGPATGGADHFYDDGYNRVDESGNAFPPGATSFWGYRSASQVFDSGADPTVGLDSIAMHATSLGSSTYLDDECVDPQFGFEVGYGRVLGHSSRVTWGLEGAFGWTDFGFKDTRIGAPQFDSLTDVYSLNVMGILVTPPLPPYEGPFEAAPGSPLLGDTPTRSVAPGTGAASGWREFDANLYSLRLGPFLDYALTKRLSLGVNAGLALLFMDGRLKYDETLSYDLGDGPVSVPQSGQSDEFSTLVGGYVGARIGYDFTPRLRLFGSASYLGASGFEQTAGSRQLELDFTQSFLLSVGLSWAF